MITHDFEYFCPVNLEEALALLVEHKDRNPKLLAGGQSLLPIMKLGLSTPDVIIDLKHIPSLSYIRMDGSAFKIGALTRHVDICESKELRDSCPMLPSAAEGIGHQLIRARGTIGGSLMHCDPRADYLIALMALEASVVVQGIHGERIIPITEFVRGPFETTVGPDEIMVEVSIPRCEDNGMESLSKFEIGHGDFGLAFVATRVWIERDICKRSVVYVSGIEEFPTRLLELESYLQNRRFDDTLNNAIDSSISKLNSTDSASEAFFRRQLVGTLLKRVLSRQTQTGA